MTETARRLKREARRQTPASERLPGNSWSSPHASSIRSFIAKKAAKAVTAAKNQGKRKKRRKGTWTQILGSSDRSAADPSGSGRRLLRPDPHRPHHSFLIEDVIDMAR